LAIGDPSPSAQDFGSRLPLVALGDSLTPAKRLKFDSPPRLQNFRK